AGQVEVTAVLEHGAGGDLAHGLALKCELRRQRVERRRQHVLVGCGRVGSVLASKRYSDAPEHRHTAGLWVHGTAPGFELLHQCRLAVEAQRHLDPGSTPTRPWW